MHPVMTGIIVAFAISLGTITPAGAMTEPSTGTTIHTLPASNLALVGFTRRPDGARAYARTLVSRHQFTCLNKLWTRESNWRYRARDNGDRVYGRTWGIPQMNPAPRSHRWRHNPVLQIATGLRYIKHRYDTPCGAWRFWRHHHWY